MEEAQSLESGHVFLKVLSWFTLPILGSAFTLLNLYCNLNALTASRYFALARPEGRHSFGIYNRTSIIDLECFKALYFVWARPWPWSASNNKLCLLCQMLLHSLESSKFST